MAGSDGEMDEILRIMASLGVELRFEHVGGRGGGLCHMGHRRVYFVDLDADTASQLDRAIQTLRDLPELDAQYLSPALRAKLKME